MLEPSEFFVGAAPDASEFALLLPYESYGEALLIVPTEERKVAVFLGGETAFQMIEGVDDNWRGILVPNIRIELDPSGIVDVSYQKRAGLIVRRADRLSILVTVGRPGFRASPLPLMHKLPSTASNAQAGFCKWQVVLGTGDEKRVLHSVDISTEKAAK